MPFSPDSGVRPTSGIVVHGHYTAKPVTVQWAGMDLRTNERIFVSKQYTGGTDSIAGFLAVVHALATTKDNPQLVYSDNYVVRYWINQRQCIYSADVIANPDLEKAILGAVKFLATNPDVINRVADWNLHVFGPNPANYWRQPFTL